MDDLTYPHAGATRTGDLPPGYRHLHRRVRLGAADVFDAAAEGLMTFGMNRGAGLRPIVSAARAAPGVTVTNRLVLGPLAITAPCRVVWTETEPDRVGWAYGTLPGHPESGEEAFVVERDADGVWFVLTVFSRPAAWYARIAGPLTHLVQDYITRRYITAMRRLAAGNARP